MKKLSDFDYKLETYQFDDLYINDLRQEFVRAFPIEFIQEKMQLDDYVEGKDNKNSFCYQLEFGLSGLGSMRGANATKFGIYYSSSQHQYVMTKKISVNDDLQLSFTKLKQELVRLLVAGKDKDIKDIEKNKFAPTVKGKILSIYYPTEYLNIFSNAMLSYFLRQFYDSSFSSASTFEKQELLLKLKRENRATKNWDNIKFGNYLYHLFPEAAQLRGNNTKAEQVIKRQVTDVQHHKRHTIKAIEKQLVSSPASRKKHIHSLGKIDYLKKQRNNLVYGDLGEKVVLEYEIERLKDYPGLVRQIKHVSLKSDAKGYDILSYEKDGRRRYIEVKSTNQTPSNKFDFILTENEKEKGKSLDNYWIYRVFNVLDNPVIYKIKNPFKSFNVNLEPVRYRATFKVQDIDDHGS